MKSSGNLLSVREGYDLWAPVYDHDRNPLPALEEPEVQRELGDVSGLEVLDLGCGTGRHALWLAEQNARVTAIDFSAQMLRQASAKAADSAIQFVQHDLHQPLPFADRMFDKLVSGLVLEHLADFGSFFAESRRVLRPGGLAVFSTLHPTMFLRGSRARFTDPTSQEDVYPGSNEHTLSDILNPLVRSGLSLRGIVEQAPSPLFAQQYPRAEKHLGWPMLLVVSAVAPG